MSVLGCDWFARPSYRVAPELLGKVLVARSRHGEIALPITEVEAYHGPRDRASHAARGETPRNRPMFGPAGVWYVYFVYGMHWMLNVVCDAPGTPSAILIRGAGDVVGPARLTKRLGVTKRFDGRPATPRTGLWVEDRGHVVPRRAVRRTPRIGVAYAGETWAAKRWRFVVEGGALPG